MQSILRNAALAALPIAALLAAPGAEAQTPAPAAGTPTAVSTTADLAAICLPATTGVQRLEAIAYCQGYVTAIGQYHAMLHPAGGRVPPLFCPPSPAPSVAQSAIAFANWAKGNPQHANEPAADGLLRWAQATYPCPDQPAAPARGARTAR
ncbi:hypothetical protein SAMN02745194_03600 [Roseomonas rosea]|uniref:Rap1a immunity protein domain-containing protein n=1 Tax=Muricoccus roseus TaxID=198092 RepID=A0A1M6MUU6_9PROT|nr:Rap1a/Tai family immunity protein [Roseomonas rosea]SHJ87241.1 hypothetical protein SAMN02745194_03600 [Roseomonas rosea]